MAYEVEQPNYYDYLETRFNENLSSNNLKMVQSLTSKKFSELVDIFNSDRNHFDFYTRNIEQEASDTNILFPYSFNPAEHDEFCPLLTSKQFGFIAQLLTLFGNGIDTQNQLTNMLKKTLLLSHKIVLPSAIESLFMQTPKMIADIKALYPDCPIKKAEEQCRESIANHLDLIFKFKKLIKADVIKFVPVQVLMDSRYSMLRLSMKKDPILEELGTFAKNNDIYLPSIKKKHSLLGVSQNDHYLQMLYPDFEITRKISKVLNTTCCIGQERYIPLIKLLNQYHTPTQNSLLNCSPELKVGSKLRENHSLLNLLNIVTPKLDELSVDDIIDIRLNNEYFNDYREQLKKGLCDIDYYLQPDMEENIKSNMLIAQKHLKSAFDSTSTISRLTQNIYSLTIGAFLTGGNSVIVKAGEVAEGSGSNLNAAKSHKAAINHCAIWL